MTRKLKAHFDGRVLIPDEAIDLPVDCPLEIQVVNPAPDYAKALKELIELAESMPDDPDAPTDGAAQHDHYLYGLPNKP